MEIILTAFGSILGIAVLIIGFFLKRTMSEYDSLKERCDENSLDIAVLTKDHENKYESLGKNMDKLSKGIEKLTDKIEHLTEIVNSK